ncbi:lysosomal alpha-mannosidase-like isoform X1 [Aphidius gifuensis]|uniref:lysosomal alpha-mannosidase-like isoform X1 n=1 Tax=Aphidius gifuensis TaxID=684658 RepID=UPI001CDD592C|nr:lysosomal alpha-mannosidase-like isoform X1 [Aphidius gifuensis]
MARLKIYQLGSLILTCVVLVNAGVFRDNNNNQNDERRTCGYEGCPKIDPTKLNVHLVAHTHDDVGWLKTVDQYYYGGRNSIQKAGVQYIIDTVIDSLRKDPERRFIYVETAFLWKWWQRQTEKLREEVRGFINEGRLEIISGAWSMNDEATTHYHSIVDQFTWGFRRLNDTFGECARPKIGWQIDPFGHSREQASLFAQFGFDGMFFGRLDHEDKTARLKEQRAEFLWKASSSLGEKADLLSVALFNNYSPPPGFCFDILCQDEPLIDDPESADNNIDSRIALFLAYCQVQAKSYNTNNIILTMGEDFNYQVARMWFSNLDKLIRYTNKIYGSQINVFYSTPSCYIKSIHEADKIWTTKSDDFFPYSSDPHAFWTGYFTSRPTLKYFERMGNNYLQIVKQLSILSSKMDSDDLQHLREVMGVMQHHDAVTGTEKQHVAEDYARLLHESIVKSSDIISDAILKIASKNNTSNTYEDTKFYSCLLLNTSTCTVSEDSKKFVVTLYNPQSNPVSSYIRIPVNGKSYIVNDHTGAEILTQLVPIPLAVVQLPGRKSIATRELVFRALNISAFGYQSYFVSEKLSDDDEVNIADSDKSISSDLYDISVDEAGQVVVQWKKENIKVVQSFHYYIGAVGDNSNAEKRASGAYIFRPNESAIHNFIYSGYHEIFKGPLVQEIHLTVNDHVSLVVRILDNEEQVEFEWLAGPIPIDDKKGKEIVIRYSSNLQSAGTFYTDSNGREMLKRKRNYRPTWNLNLQEPIAGNYYPVTAKISLEDRDKGYKLSVLNDRAQGGSSLTDGELELMIHRRLLVDDAFGVEEALNEQAFGTGLVARGIHYLVGGNLNNLDTIALAEKSMALKLSLRPWALFTPLNNTDNFINWKNNYNMKAGGLRKKLPKNIHILTYEPWKNGEILLRLEHLYEIGEATQLSQPAEINIGDLFTDFDITSLRETSLGGNQWIESMNRFKWKSDNNDIEYDVNNTSVDQQVYIKNGVINVLLRAREIRTFIITGTKKTSTFIIDK